LMKFPTAVAARDGPAQGRPRRRPSQAGLPSPQTPRESLRAPAKHAGDCSTRLFVGSTTICVLLSRAPQFRRTTSADHGARAWRGIDHQFHSGHRRPTIRRHLRAAECLEVSNAVGGQGRNRTADASQPFQASAPGILPRIDANRAFVRYFRALANMGTTVIVLHQTGKGESAKLYRGSSDIISAAELDSWPVNMVPAQDSMLQCC
jgi:hypothetical protein